LKHSRWVALISLAGIVLLSSCGGSKAPAFNATPVIQNLFPSNITAGSDGFTMSVQGTGFISGNLGVSFVYWNGSARSTSFNVTTGQLQAQIPASDVLNANTIAVTVVNPEPGGGESADASFTITPLTNGAPSMTLPFSPASAKAGDAAFTLTVNGNNFAVNDPVTWNGSVRATTFVNQNQVTAAITNTDIAQAGSGSVAVNTPGLVIASPSRNFPVTGPNNPMPGVSSLSPISTASGGADFELTIGGSGFVSTSTVEFGGLPVATAFVSGSQLVALIPAADITSAATVDVGVTNPAPGGGTSKTLPFKID
jgi:IPT/TIG domain